MHRPLHSTLCYSSHILYFSSTIDFYWNYYHRHLHSFPTRRSSDLPRGQDPGGKELELELLPVDDHCVAGVVAARSEEHTSELQSRGHLVCRLLLEKKKNQNQVEFDDTKPHSSIYSYQDFVHFVILI